jgi:hypothetical protein
MGNYNLQAKQILFFLISFLGITFLLMGGFFLTGVFGGIIPGQLLDWEWFAADSEFANSAKEPLLSSHSQIPFHQMWEGFAVFIGCQPGIARCQQNTLFSR